MATLQKDRRYMFSLVLASAALFKGNRDKLKTMH